MKKTPAVHVDRFALPSCRLFPSTCLEWKLIKLNNRLNRPFSTPLPADLKCGLERVTRFSMDHIRVNFNSFKPATLNAQAYTQGADIYLAPGMEKLLAHESWHAVQQLQKRVPVSFKANGLRLNDDPRLEREADILGELAVRLGRVALKKPSVGLMRKSPIRFKLPQFKIIQKAGSGGVKIGFIKEEITDLNRADEDKINEGFAILLGAWKLVQDERHAEKDKIGKKAIMANKLEKDKLGMELGEGFKPTDTKKLKLPAIRTELNLTDTDFSDTDFSRYWAKHLTQYYSDLLTDIDEELAALKKKLQPNKTISISGNDVKYKEFTPALPKPLLRLILVGKIVNAESAFTKKPPGLNEKLTVRPIFVKKGLEKTKTSNEDAKEYVKDYLNVFTRRYAYVEKNYHQMMEFFSTGYMTGRYQQYLLMAGCKTPDIFEKNNETISKVAINKDIPRLTSREMAVVHQMYGSLPEQRGVSMTSTPKVGVTFANTGGNFRTDNGFKLKIDLSRVPEHVMLINHYSHGGVSQFPNQYSTIQHHKTGTPKYKYKESALHARELFLEYILPEWVVEIEFHPKAANLPVLNKSTTLDETQKGGDLFEEAKKAFGGTRFEAGFIASLNDMIDLTEMEVNYQKGCETGKLVKNGYAKGLLVNNTKGKGTDPAKLFMETMNDEIGNEYSQFHLGYLLARSEQPLFKTVFDFKCLMNPILGQLQVQFSPTATPMFEQAKLAFSFMGLDFGAFDLIDKTYKNLALKYHPDRGGDAELMKKLIEAIELLRELKSNPKYSDEKKKILQLTGI